MQTRRAPGFVLWTGASQLDGQQIVAIVTTKSRNGKTGQMAQVWILRADVDPHAAAKSGADVSICGNCPLRRNQGGACYVLPFKAPINVWRAWQRGSYGAEVEDRAEAGRGLNVRLGAYGDPAAVPVRIWRQFLRHASGWTGYTHQWRSRPALRRYVMASVESEAEAAEAVEKGWRAFRVRHADSRLLPNEIVCPASDEGGHRVDCASCQLCRGTTVAAKNVAIVVHGGHHKRLLEDRQPLPPEAVEMLAL